MQVLAMYLPQFHRVPENDAWWGEGYTDWIAARNAKSLFEQHYQPHVPEHENYYNLLDKDVMQWQSDMMNTYGIDGMCFYHYWFKDGRKILEKPAENLLKWKEINMPFCFYWANETWARSWSNIAGANSWTLDDNEDKNGPAILLEQSYGDKKDWKEHFEYLYQFFCDSRYIKIEDKPVIMIYKSNEINCLSEMLEYWNQLAEERGLKGVYVIASNADDSITSLVDSFLVHEPANSMGRLVQNQFSNDLNIIDYCEVWNEILSARKRNRKTYYCGFVGYDDTPRRGINGNCITNYSPELFEEYMVKLMAKTELEGNDIVFVNAWNEWGEGMHLEPDEKYGKRFLEGLANAKKKYKDYLEKYKNESISAISINEKLQDRCNKFENYLNLLSEWMELKENDISLVQYFKKNHYKKIAIYGYGMFGRHLLHELNNSEIEVVCIIDKQKDKLKIPYVSCLPSDEIPYVDVVVVASFHFYDDIVNEMNSSKLKFVSIKSIIKEVRKLSNLIG